MDPLSADIPREITGMIASGLSLPEILNLCRANRTLNERICRNPDFYRALLVRDYGSWRYSYLPQEVLPLEQSVKNVNWLDGFPVYWGTPFNTAGVGPHPNAFYGAHRTAAYPGTQNTVQIHNEHYVWYYFFWAPKFHPMVNYGKKHTDEEILNDLRTHRIPNRYLLGYVNQEDLDAVRDATRDERYALRNELNKRNVPGPIGLTNKRLQHLTLAYGFVGELRRMTREQILALIDDPPRGFVQLGRRAYVNSLFDLRNWPNDLFAQVFAPRTYQDMALEYVRGASLAFLASRTTDPEDRKRVYADLLAQYNVSDQLEARTQQLLAERIRNRSDYDKVTGLHREVARLLRGHETEYRYGNGDVRRMRQVRRRSRKQQSLVQVRNPLLPMSESLWSEELYQRMVALHLAATRALRLYREERRVERERLAQERRRQQEADEAMARLVARDLDEEAQQAQLPELGDDDGPVPQEDEQEQLPNLGVDNQREPGRRARRLELGEDNQLRPVPGAFQGAPLDAQPVPGVFQGFERPRVVREPVPGVFQGFGDGGGFDEFVRLQRRNREQQPPMDPDVDDE